MSITLPDLPDLPTDAILEVYTHSSLGGMGFPDNSKYVVVGVPAAETHMAMVLLADNPKMVTAELRVSEHRFKAISLRETELFVG